MITKKINLLRKCYSFILSKRQVSYLGKWKHPEGFDTGIEVYNSSAGKKVPFVLRRPGIASWYMCGPTVYAESHIGHACCYVKFDIIRRILENFFNIQVVLLLGITDIDDKIIKRSNMEGVCAKDLARKYELDFFKDMDSLRVMPPTVIGRVSENISLIIEFCEKLIKQNYAYVTDDGNVYFMVSKSVSAEVLQEISSDFQTNTYIDPKKKDPRDFALWKAAKENEPFWESPWGRGRPGWHIECSAIASKIFGADLDIHSGGYDLIFPHHSCEKSQSEAYHECSQWGNYWLHTGLLHTDDEKMSKSLNNTISIKNFLKDHSTNDFRILCLQSLFRKNLVFNSETLMGAKSLHKKLHNFIVECEEYISDNFNESRGEDEKLLSKLLNTKDKFKKFLASDFNTSQALLCITDLIDEVNKYLQKSYSDPSKAISNTVTAACSSYVNSMLETFGIHVISKKNLSKDFIFAVDSIVKLRNDVRLLAFSPESIETNEGIDNVDFIENLQRNLREKLDLVYRDQVFPENIEKLVIASKIFCENSSSFLHKLSKEQSGNSSIDLKSVKKKMSPLYKFCDEFRSNCLENGIGIKDRGCKSSWIPLAELQKFL